MRHHHFREREPHYYAGKYKSIYFILFVSIKKTSQFGWIIIFFFWYKKKTVQEVSLFFFNRFLYKQLGAVRAESFIRPKSHYADTIINGVQESRQENFIPDCTPDPTLGEALLDTEEPLNLDEDEEELLQKLANRHYYR